MGLASFCFLARTSSSLSLSLPPPPPAHTYHPHVSTSLVSSIASQTPVEPQSNLSAANSPSARQTGCPPNRPVFAHMGRISITEPSLQRPDILVHLNQQPQLQQVHHGRQYEMSSSAAASSSSHDRSTGCVVVASTQSNLLLLYSLPPPQPHSPEKRGGAPSEGVVGTRLPPVGSPVRGKITLPTGHLVRGVCFGPGLGLGSTSVAGGDVDEGEVWVLSLMKEKRGTTSLASIGNSLLSLFCESHTPLKMSPITTLQHYMRYLRAVSYAGNTNAPLVLLCHWCPCFPASLVPSCHSHLRTFAALVSSHPVPWCHWCVLVW